jgi:hypothetical protein
MYLGAFGKHCSDSYRLKGIKESGMYNLVCWLDYRELHKQHGDNFVYKINEMIGDNEPDVLLINKGELITGDHIKYWKENFENLVVAYWYGDMRDGISEYVLDKISGIDLFLTNCDEDWYVDEISKLGIDKHRIFFSHTATDCDTFKQQNVEKQYDIIFFGGNYKNKFDHSEIRTNYIQRLINSGKYSIKIFGLNWNTLGAAERPVYGDTFSKQASKAKIILGFSSYLDRNHYTSNRIWNSMACGFHLTHYFKGIEDYFENGKDLVWFDTYEEMDKQIDYYLKNKKERNEIFLKGRENICNNHTYKNRAIEMYKIFKKFL